MDKEKMVLYLGYCALILIAIYFTYGILKVSGEGLASLGYENNFIREGFSDKEKEVKEKDIKRNAEQMKGTEEFLGKIKENLNAVNDMPEYEELIESYSNYIDTMLRGTLMNSLTSKKGLDENTMKLLLRLRDQKDLLDNYTL